MPRVTQQVISRPSRVPSFSWTPRTQFSSRKKVACVSVSFLSVFGMQQGRNRSLDQRPRLSLLKEDLLFRSLAGATRQGRRRVSWLDRRGAARPQELSPLTDG